MQENNRSISYININGAKNEYNGSQVLAFNWIHYVIYCEWWVVAFSNNVHKSKAKAKKKKEEYEEMFIKCK